MRISPAVRAAIAAGTSAGVVVSLMVLGADKGTVRVETSSVEAPPTTAAAQTTTTNVPATAPSTPPPTPNTGPSNRPVTTTSTAAPTTTTTAPPPHTCLLIRGQAVGTASGTPTPSERYPGRWDRHSSIAITNPVDEPVTLKGAWIATGQTVSDGQSMLERVFETVGIRLAAGESVTVEQVTEGYDQKPPSVVGLAGVEFAPASAPELNCIADHPRYRSSAPYIRDNTGYTVPSAPTVPCETFNGLPESASDGRARFTFRTLRWFPGLNVRYQVNLRGGMREFTVEFPRNQITAAGYVDWNELGEPLSMSVLAVEWEGGTKLCEP